MLFIVIQFIQPSHNKTEQLLSTDLAKLYPMPAAVKNVLQNACYDCHSNNTRYPWYSNVQPIGWLMANHIKNGKGKLNFNEFGNYTSRKQISKLRESANQVRDEEMPIASYKIMHNNARLSKEQKNKLMEWMNKTADSLSAN